MLCRKCIFHSKHIKYCRNEVAFIQLQNIVSIFMFYVLFFFVLLRKWFLISIRIPFSISNTLVRAEKKWFWKWKQKKWQSDPEEKLILKSLCAQLHMVFSQKKNKINYFQWTEWKSIKCFCWHYWFSLRKHVNHCIDVVLNIKLASSSLFFFILCYPSFILRHPWWKIDFGWFEICFRRCPFLAFYVLLTC